MGGIFISYRRGDSAGYAGRLSDHLRDHFGSDKVFMDIETIEIGEDFVEALQRAVSCCTVLIAVIGPSWLTASNASGKRRLDDRNDFIRLELAAALERKIRVIPVLVQDAAIPKEDELPDDLKSLTRRQTLRLSNESWEYDVNRLCQVLERDLGIAPSALARKRQKTQGRTDGTKRGYLIFGTLLVAALATGVAFYFSEGRKKVVQPQLPPVGTSTVTPKPKAETPPVAEVPSPTPVRKKEKPAAEPRTAHKPKQEKPALPLSAPTVTHMGGETQGEAAGGPAYSAGSSASNRATPVKPTKPQRAQQQNVQPTRTSSQSQQRPRDFSRESGEIQERAKRDQKAIESIK